jgi:hypothetical protein
MLGLKIESHRRAALQARRCTRAGRTDALLRRSALSPWASESAPLRSARRLHGLSQWTPSPSGAAAVSRAAAAAAARSSATSFGRCADTAGGGGRAHAAYAPSTPQRGSHTLPAARTVTSAPHALTFAPSPSRPLPPSFDSPLLHANREVCRGHYAAASTLRLLPCRLSWPLLGVRRSDSSPTSCEQGGMPTPT